MNEQLSDFGVWSVTDVEKDASKQRGHRSGEAKCESHSAWLKRRKAQGPVAHDKRHDAEK
jgi:hypothetical protein